MASQITLEQHVMFSDRTILILYEATSYDMLLSSPWFPAGTDSGGAAAQMLQESACNCKATSLNPCVDNISGKS